MQQQPSVPMVPSMTTFQQPVVPLADVMQFMFQFMAQQSHFVQQQVSVTTPVPPSPQLKPASKQASTSRPWTNDPQWQDTNASAMDESDEDDEATEDSDE